MEKRFHVINGGLKGNKDKENNDLEGPLSRLGLKEKYRPLKPYQWVLIFLPKVILFSILLYFILQYSYR